MKDDAVCRTYRADPIDAATVFVTEIGPFAHTVWPHLSLDALVEAGP